MREIWNAMASGLALFIVVFMSPSEAATTEQYPVKPIRLVVPFAPGGGTDVLARIIAPKLSERLGQQVIVENRTGAGGNVGTEAVAKSAPDGYTMLLAYIGPFAVGPSLNQKLNFDPVRDFRAVSLMATIPLVLVVHPSMPADSVKKLIALAKTQPDKLTYGSAGNGTAQQLAGELFKLLTGTKITAVPYRGGGPASVAILTGEVDLLFTGALGVFPHVNAGRLRALAVTTRQRLASAPQLPTVAESGVKDFEVVSWNGIVMPTGTPHAIVLKMNASITEVLRSPDVEGRLRSQGLNIVASSPERFDQFIRDEITKWAKVVRAAGIKAE